LWKKRRRAPSESSTGFLTPLLNCVVCSVALVYIAYTV
jgi:hypothetical protein